MKTCSYCGKEYVDDVTVCAIDGEPVISRELDQKGFGVQPAPAQKAFTAKLVSPVSSAGTYRIFVGRDDLIFILLEGGPKSAFEAMAHLLGPVGNLVPLAFWLFGRKKEKRNLERVEDTDPEDLLRESDKNFKLHLAEIREAAIEPSKLLATSGKAGRLNFLVRHGEKLEFEFENAAEMSTAIRLLGRLFNSTLRINVEWNGQKQKFEKKKTS